MTAMVLPFEASSSLEAGCRAVGEILSSHRRMALAFSGGVDSTFLAWLVHGVLKKELAALLVITPFISQREVESADRVAREIGLSLETLSLNTLAVASIRENSTRRCYFCKKAIMTRVQQRARELDCSVILDGSHAGDARAHRPGKKALEELNIRSPLAEVGMEKQEIRTLSRLTGLSTWKKASQSCLATRVPYDTELTHVMLRRIEQAEDFLQDLGCEQVRVRCHGTLARIEVPAEYFSMLLDDEKRRAVTSHFKRLGFDHISLDLEGYRSGSWDAL